MFEADSQIFASAPLAPREFKRGGGGGGELLGLDPIMSYLVPRRGRNGKSGTT